MTRNKTLETAGVAILTNTEHMRNEEIFKGNRNNKETFIQKETTEIRRHKN